MIKKYLLIGMLLLSFMSYLSVAADFFGSAIHEQKQAAKEQSLADLQQNIYVNVESTSKSFQTNKGDDYFEFTSSLSSTLILIGVESDCYQVMKAWQCDAELKNKVSSSLYSAAIEQKYQRIDKQWLQIKNIASAQVKYDELRKLLPLLQETQQLVLVLKMLNPAAKVGTAKVNSAQISDEIVALETTAKSITMAARLLIKKITQKNILVKAFTPYHSHEVTPFASALQSELNQKLSTVNDTHNASYTMQGKYRINKNTIQVEAQLVDNAGRIFDASVVSIDKKSLSNHRYKPTGSNFEQMLLSGKIIGDDFTVKLSTNRGSRNIIFRDNETVQLLVKANKPSYFYIIAHSTNNKNKLSYLLDLNDSNTDEKFIQYLGFEEVNQWVVIAEFDIEEPFGQEALQLFASTTKPLDMLPSTQYDGTYYRIQGTKDKVVRKTRGFVRKNNNKTADGKIKRQVAEAVLNINTAK